MTEALFQLIAVTMVRAECIASKGRRPPGSRAARLTGAERWNNFDLQSNLFRVGTLRRVLIRVIRIRGMFLMNSTPRVLDRLQDCVLRRSIVFAVISAGVLGLAPYSVHLVGAQSSRDLNQLAQLEARYGEQKNSGQWSAASKTARQIVAFCKQHQMSAVLQLGALDMLALAELNLGHFKEANELYQQVVTGARQTRPRNTAYAEALQLVTFNGLQGVARCYREFGDYEEATKAFHAAVDYARKIDRPLEAAAAEGDLGHLLLGRGLYDEAITEFRGSIRVLSRVVRSDKTGVVATNYANALQGLSLAYMNLGRYNEAEPAARSAVEWMGYTFGRTHTFRANALKVLALVYSYQNRYEEALPLYEEAVRIYTELVGADHPHCLGIMNNLARMYALTGRPDEAVEMATAVLEGQRKQSGRDHLNTINATINLANILFQLDRYDDAAPLIEEAIATCDATLPDNHPVRLEALKLGASVEFLRGGDIAHALARLNGIMAILESNTSSPVELAGVLAIRALVREKLGQREEAIADIEEAIKHAELQRALASGGERERAKLFEDFALFYGHAILWHTEEGGGGIPSAFEMTERMKARSFLDVLHTSNFDFLEGLPAAERERYRAEEKQLRDAVTEAQQHFDNVVAHADTDDEKKRQAATAVYIARDRLYDHLMSVQNANPTYRELIVDGNEPATISDVQANLLGEDELMLSYASFGTRMFVFSVRKDEAEFHELLVDEAQAKVLGIDTGELGKSDLSKIFLGEGGLLESLSQPSASSNLNDKLMALWHVLVPEEDRAALADGSVKTLTVLPDGLLALLPMETLVVERNETGPVYLLDVGPPIAYAPSASVMTNLARREVRPPSGDREPVLTLGDPAYGETNGNGTRAANFRAGLHRLPYSGYEASWVAQQFSDHGMKTVKLVGDQATEAQVRRLIGGRQIVHLACHGMAEDLYGNFFGCLAVAAGRQGDSNDDGFLYTPEIYDLDLSGCELAILSACQTNFGPQQTGEGVWTISRGFLVSGARRVVASNWVVDDEAGATLVSYFADFLTDDEHDTAHRNYAAALHKAKQAVRKKDKWSHPFYWSSLVLVGPSAVTD